MTKVHNIQESGATSIPLAINISINGLEGSVPAVFRQDGTGCLEPEYNWDKFSHDLDLVALQTRFPDRTELEKYLVSYFWEKVNANLADPLLTDYSDLEGHELNFVTGQAEEFNHLMQLFLLTEPELEKTGEDSVAVSCGYEEQEPHLEEEWGYTSDRLQRLLNLALKEHRPYGYQYEYNDQRGDRRSGYSLSPAYLNYELDDYLAAPARERMNARRELRQWLIERSENPAEYDLQSWEKVSE